MSELGKGRDSSLSSNKPVEQTGQRVSMSLSFFIPENSSPISPDKIKNNTNYIPGIRKAEDLLAKAKNILPRNQNESDFDYEVRVLSEIQNRFEKRFIYIGKKDDIFDLSKQLDGVRDERVLLGIEYAKVRRIIEENKRIISETPTLDGLKRRSVKTEISGMLDPYYLEGSLEPYFEQEKNPDDPTEMQVKKTPAERVEQNGKKYSIEKMAIEPDAKADLYAIALVADKLLDIVEPPSREWRAGDRTYRQHMKQLERVLTERKKDPSDSSKYLPEHTHSQQERDEAARELVRLKKGFYARVINALRYLEVPGRVAEDQTAEDMYKKLNEIKKTPVKELINDYIGVRTGLNKERKVTKEIIDGKEQKLMSNKEEMYKLVDDGKFTSTIILDFALKGADLLERRTSILEKPKLHPVPPIYLKDKKQGTMVPQSLQEAAGIVPEPGRDKGKPPGRQGELAPAPTGQPSGDENKEDHKEKDQQGEKEGPKKPEPAPPKKEEEKKEPPKEPGPLTPAPPEGMQQKESLEERVSFAAVANPNRRVENVLQIAEHSFAHDLKRKPSPWFARTPWIGKALWAMWSPRRLIIQNTLLRSVFEQQHVRFTSDAVDVLKRSTDRTIPIEVTPDVIDTALEEGRIERGRQNLLRRVGWKIWDQIANTTGIGQTSEQVYARRWLENQMAHPPNNRHERIREVTNRTFIEQTKLGERFAEKIPQGLSLEQANRFTIAQGVGEQRYLLGQQEEAIQTTANARIKNLLSQYATGTQNIEWLIAGVNRYLSTDFRSQLPQHLQEVFNANEISTNIISIAEKIKQNWNRYQQERSDINPNLSKWDAFHFDIFVGRGEWGGVRGRSERSLFMERLARRMAERPSFLTGYTARGVALLNDVITFGGAYAGGFIGSSLTYGSNAFLRTMSGSLGVGFVAGIKETGLAIPWTNSRFFKGRYQREVDQLSREAARGRLSPENASVRREMEEILVQREQAYEISQRLERFLSKREFTDAERKEFLRELATADARMRISDLSGTVGLSRKTQNYIEYTEGKENEEYVRLKKALLEGAIRLNTLPENQRVTPEKFDQYSHLAESQFRVSSARERVVQWLQRQHYPTDALQEIMSGFDEYFNLGVVHENSLLWKDRRLGELARHRAYSVMTLTTIAGTGLGFFATPITQEASKLLGYIGQSHGQFLGVPEGLQTYVDHWRYVWHGEKPADTFMQKAVMSLHTPGRVISGTDEVAAAVVTPSARGAGILEEQSRRIFGEALHGVQAVEQWLKNSTSVDHREWYTNDTSIPDGNELRLYTYKDGDKVILDMSKMTAAVQAGAHPSAINVQDYIHNGQAGFALSLPGHTDQVIWIKAIGGKFVLDPENNQPIEGTNLTNSQLYRMLINQEALHKLQDGDIATELYDRQNIFKLGTDGKMGFIEAARTANIEGRPVLQVFATIHGGGNVGVAPVEIPVVPVPPQPIPTPEVPRPTSPWGDFYVIPAPMRQNIEKSIKGNEKKKTETEQQEAAQAIQQKNQTQLQQQQAESEEEKKKKELQEVLKREKPSIEKFIQMTPPEELAKQFAIHIDLAKKIKEDEKERTGFIVQIISADSVLRQIEEDSPVAYQKVQDETVVEHFTPEEQSQYKEAREFFNKIQEAVNKRADELQKAGEIINNKEKAEQIVKEEKRKLGITEIMEKKMEKTYIEFNNRIIALLRQKIKNDPRVIKRIKEYEEILAEESPRNQQAKAE